MLQRNLFSTGVTRGKRLVVLVGQKKAVAIAVRNVSGRLPWRISDRSWTPPPAHRHRPLDLASILSLIERGFRELRRLLPFILGNVWMTGTLNARVLPRP
jgi:hypothetical protein